MTQIARSGELDCPPYSSWEHVAGYFDGDGNVGLEVVKRILRLKLRFVDTWRPQIASIALFLAGRGVRSGNIGKDVKSGNWQPGYRLDITEVRSVLETAKAMFPHAVKKRAELRAVIDYLAGSTTGNDLIHVFNEEIKSGRRRGKIREERVPLRRVEGLRLSQHENARNARTAYARDVSSSLQESIRRDHVELKLGHIRLSKKYGYSASVTRRILGEK